MQPMREPKRSQEEEQERPKWNQSYTVGKPARKLKPRQNEKESYAFLCMIKCTVAGILTCAVLCCLVASKVSVLVLGQIYRDAVERGKSDTVLSKKSAEDSANATTLPLGSNNAVKEAVFVMLVLILIIPQAVSLIVAAWVSLFQKSHPWPSKAAIAWILFGGLLEVACLSYLCLCTLTVYDVPLGLFVLLMSALFIIPTLWQAIKIRRFSNTKYGRIRLALFVFAAVLLIGGLVVLAYQTITHTHARIGVPVAFFVLSYAWSPQIRELQTQPKRLPRARDELSDVTTSHQEQDLTSPSLKLTKKMARDKAAILISLWKIILTPFVCALLCHLYSIAELSSLRQGFLHIASFRPALDFFLLQIFSTFLGYHLAWLACSMCMQKAAFALPLTFCTPIVVVLVTVKGACGTSWIPLSCSYSEEHFVWIIALGLSMWVGQFLSTGYYVWKNQGFVMAKASFLFWIPSYNGLMLEQNLLLNRRNEVTDESHVTQKVLKRDTHVFICTTMYHEADYEMEQLLNSLHDVDRYRRKARRHIESHVFFDGCIKSDELNSYILQLVSLVESTLRIPLNKCTKMKTPYGMQLRWKLPGGMPFTIHLKDNNKVKNKKRWSQVMYMSYVVDFKRKIHNIRDDQTFILTTDADVNFKHESMEALIDYMLQDEKVGAVCGRTHPMGKGPLVWYQIFDYAIGHWFQKVANHMLGSVLCCPGCFSLYRCKAVKDILPEYSTNVNEASEFLTKDMGEDRWMCTLMVQAGWRLLYCAAAEDVTYCPTTFDEFYNQRRRWMPSTLANLILLISEWRLVVTNNDYISVPFIIFQLILLLATVIGPSTVILVITGGMNYVGIATNEVTTVTIMSLITLAFGLICLFTSQSFQLLIAKLLTFAFSIVMLMVAVGVAVQISKDLEKREAARNSLNSTSTSELVVLPASVSTLYLGGLTGIFVLAALLHPKEAYCLLNGIFYLLCLPSGYLLLTVYSIVNITDRSWGTREAKTAKPSDGHGEWYTPFTTLFKRLCPCLRSCEWPCAKDEEKRATPNITTEPYARRFSRCTDIFDDDSTSSGITADIDRTFFNGRRYSGPTGLQRSGSSSQELRVPADGWQPYPLGSYINAGMSRSHSDIDLARQYYSQGNPGYAGSDMVQEYPQYQGGRPLSPLVLQQEGNHRTFGAFLTPDDDAVSSVNQYNRPQPCHHRRSRSLDGSQILHGESYGLMAYKRPTDNPNHLAPRCACHPLQKPDDDYLGRARTNRSRSLDDIDSPQVINLRDIHCNLGTWDARFGFQQQSNHASTPHMPGQQLYTEERRPFYPNHNHLCRPELHPSATWDVYPCAGTPRNNRRVSYPQQNGGNNGRRTSGPQPKVDKVQVTSHDPNDPLPDNETRPMSKMALEYLQKRRSWELSDQGVSPTPVDYNPGSPVERLEDVALQSEDLEDGQNEQSEVDGTRNKAHPKVYFSGSVKTRTSSSGKLTDETKFDGKVTVEEWLQGELEVYIEHFKEHGYDNLEMVALMTEKDLDLIGIEIRGHKQKLARRIKTLPRIEREEGIPESVEEWLKDLGLGEYWPYFVGNCYTEPSDLEDLKDMGHDQVTETFNIHKQGHVAMMIQAIRKLQYPNKGQLKIRQARRELARLPLLRMDLDNGDHGREFDFWEGLRRISLEPEAAAFSTSSELKEKLTSLRNSVLVIFFVANVLWMLLIMVLARHQSLKVLGVDVIGLGFLIVYGVIIIVQFLTMVCHRLATMIHVLARAPWTCGKDSPIEKVRTTIRKRTLRKTPRRVGARNNRVVETR